MNKKKIAFHTFGCKLNFAETSAIARKFTKEEFETVDFREKADIYVIHSCTVTAQAEKKCKAAIRQSVKRNPNASVAVIGCYAELKPDELKKMPGVKIVLGNSDKYKLPEKYSEAFAENQQTDPEQSETNINLKTSRIFEPGYSVSDRTRSFFKVQDGCDYFCTYCAIPYARGRSRSATVSDTLKVAREIASTDVREIVLTGVNIGDFGRNSNESFLDLLTELKELQGIERIRISSIEPELLNDEIIELVKSSEKLMPHFHIPLQSGTDRILKLMKRKYNTDLYAQRVRKIKELLPDACIAGDLITGFPGETEDDFIDTVNFIRSVDISYLHIFTYSSRPGTPSEKMEEQVSEEIKSRRSKLLHFLSEEKKENFYKANIGTKHKVLWESDMQDGFMYGFTDNYIRCKSRYEPEKVNEIEEVILDSIGKDGVFLVVRND